MLRNDSIFVSGVVLVTRSLWFCLSCPRNFESISWCYIGYLKTFCWIWKVHRIKLKLQLSLDPNPSKMVSCDLFYPLSQFSVIFPATSKKPQQQHLKNAKQIIWTYCNYTKHGNEPMFHHPSGRFTRCQETPKLPCDTPSKAGPNKAPAVNIAAPWGTKSWCSNKNK